jgi:tRNA threonylcarbamoyladenosine biosynthesis protein TsaE
MAVRLVSQSEGETQRTGEQLGSLLSAGDIVCLYGELGTGKTVLTKGLAAGLGVTDRERVRSPSFVLIRQYRGRVPVYHADLYRLSDPTDIADIGLREWLGGEGVAIIEWADKLEASLPFTRLDVSLAYHGEAGRLITIHPRGERYCLLMQDWLNRWGGPAETGDQVGPGGGTTLV